MKTFIFLIASILGASAASAASDLDKYDSLKSSDQQYYKNDSFSGNNKMERIDGAVKEINKLHGEIAAMKSDIAQLKAEIQQLKAQQK